MDQLLLMNVTRRVLSLLREAASANVASDAILEEEAKQILRDLHFDTTTSNNDSTNMPDKKEHNNNNHNNNKEDNNAEGDDEDEVEESELADKTTISSEKSPTSESDLSKMKRICFPRANSVDVLHFATSPLRCRKWSI